jgi:hypothetical protein
MRYNRGPYPDGEGVNLLILALILLPCVLIWAMVQAVERVTQYLVYDAPLAGIVVGLLIILFWLAMGSALAVTRGKGRATIRVIWGVGAYGAALLVVYVWLHIFKRHDLVLTNLPREFWKQIGFWMFLDVPPVPLGPILIVGVVWFFVYICRLLNDLNLSPLTDLGDAIFGTSYKRSKLAGATGGARSLLHAIVTLPKYAWDLYTEPWRTQRAVADEAKPPQRKSAPRTRSTRSVPARPRAPWEEDPDFL